MKKIDTLFDLIDGTLPRWVFLWIAGPTVALILAFTGWTAIKGMGNTESIIEIRAESKAITANVAALMKHFDLTPVVPKDIPKK